MAQEQTAASRIADELKDIEKNKDAHPLWDAAPNPIADDAHKWQLMIVGPPDTPYADGVFTADVTFPPDYPAKAPRIEFSTKMYHTNFGRKGPLRLDILCGPWSPDQSLSTIAEKLLALVKKPNDMDVVPEIEEKFKKNRAEHDRMAKEWTVKYAM